MKETQATDGDDRHGTLNIQHSRTLLFSCKYKEILWSLSACVVKFTVK